MKIIDFDLEKAKSGEYEIETENGSPVRIICWDKQDGEFKLVGLVKDTDGYEYCKSYDEHGDAHEGDSSFDLRLVCPDPVSELTDFEYKVGCSMYGSYIDEMNEEGLACVRATARELFDLAKMELYDEAWFVKEQPVEQENDGMCDENKPTKMFIDELKERLELALDKYWRPSDKSAVCDIRYTIQDNVIYDCVSGKEMPICDAVNVVVNALNHRNEYWDIRSATIHDLDVINKHITESALSDEVTTRLNKCGWFVCEKERH